MKVKIGTVYVLGVRSLGSRRCRHMIYDTWWVWHTCACMDINTHAHRRALLCCLLAAGWCTVMHVRCHNYSVGWGTRTTCRHSIAANQ